MRVLVDECAPKVMKAALAAGGHECTTVQEAGWSGITNGELLALAEASFDVLVTIDRNLRYQQNLPRRKIALLVVRARTNRVVDLQPHFAACIEALRTIQPGAVVEVGISW
jgi:predicted nuclease of predicted toxin-antitoxin system